MSSTPPATALAQSTAKMRNLMARLENGESIDAEEARDTILDLTPLVSGLDRAVELVYIGDGEDPADSPTGTPRRQALLRIIEEWGQPDAGMLSKLPKPTRRENQKGRCDEAAVRSGKCDVACGGWHGLPAIHIDYMGHADVTEALLKIDPEWNWRPAAHDPRSGGPAIVPSFGKVGGMVMWAYLTIFGVERLCVGTAQQSKEELEKELIGDMIRNGALRFGIAIRLWSKADHIEQKDDDDDPANTPARVERTGRARAQVAEQSAAAAQDAGGDAEAETAGQAAAAEDGTPANRLASIATTGPLKNKAIKVGRDLAGDYSREAPRSFEDLLGSPDPMLEEIIEAIAS